MGLLQLPQKRSNGIDLIDSRASLYYNKYQYRARLYCQGISICWFCEDPEQVDNRITKHKARWKNADPETIKKFIEWRKVNVGKGKNKTATVRIEGNVAAVFSNDLNLLKTLDSIANNVDYTEVDSSIPEGIRYFSKEPTYKYRIYLKSKRVKDDFHQKLGEFVNRYKNTDNKMIPSPSLKMWLSIKKDPTGNRWAGHNWKLEFCSSHFFLDYNEESSLTLFMLIFQDSVSRKFKLEKRPD